MSPTTEAKHLGTFSNNEGSQVRECGAMVKHVPSMCKALGLIYSNTHIHIHPKTKKQKRERGWQTLSIKDQIANILSFMGHMISVTTLQLCLCNIQKYHKYYINKLAWLYFKTQNKQKKPFTKTRKG